MTRRLILPALGLMAGLFMTASPASAQVVADFNLNPSIDSATGLPVAGSSGTYRVIVTQLGANSFQVEVIGRNDGNPNPGPPVPKAGGGLLSINFTNAGMGAMDTVAGAGSATAYNALGVDADGNPAGSNVGGPGPQTFGAVGGALWSPSGGFTLTWAAPVVMAASDINQYIAPRGGNSFTGVFSFGGIGGFNPAFVQASLQDGGQQWSGRGTIIPEPVSMALMLPGLAPLGLAWLRRRRNSKAEAEEETTA